jgi:hypothetical protein
MPAAAAVARTGGSGGDGPEAIGVKMMGAEGSWGGGGRVGEPNLTVGELVAVVCRRRASSVGGGKREEEGDDAVGLGSFIGARDQGKGDTGSAAFSRSCSAGEVA